MLHTAQNMRVPSRDFTALLGLISMWVLKQLKRIHGASGAWSVSFYCNADSSQDTPLGCLLVSVPLLLFYTGNKSLAPSQSMDKHFQDTSLYTFFCCVYLQTPLCRENCPQSKHILTALVYIITFKWSIKRLQIYLKIQSYEISLQRQKFT